MGGTIELPIAWISSHPFALVGLVIAGLLVPAGRLLLSWVVRRAQFRKFPLLDKELDPANPGEVYLEGYGKFRNDIYRIATPDCKQSVARRSLRDGD